MTITDTIAKAIKIPKSDPSNGGLKTPKTPQDEAISFFGQDSHQGEPIQVWELWLEDDGGPGENKSVSSMSSGGPPVQSHVPVMDLQTATPSQDKGPCS